MREASLRPHDETRVARIGESGGSDKTKAADAIESEADQYTTVYVPAPLPFAKGHAAIEIFHFTRRTLESKKREPEGHCATCRHDHGRALVRDVGDGAGGAAANDGELARRQDLARRADACVVFSVTESFSFTMKSVILR